MADKVISAGVGIAVAVIIIIFVYQFIAGSNTDSVPDQTMSIINVLGLFLALGALVGTIAAVITRKGGM